MIIVIIKKGKNYLNIARELRKLWNMSLKVIQIVTGILEQFQTTLAKELEELDIGGRMETIKKNKIIEIG